MKKKSIKVNDILDLMKDTDKVDIGFYAYGIKSCDTWEDGFRTVRDIREGMSDDLFYKEVKDIHSGIDTNAENESLKAVTIILATLTKDE